MMAPTGNASLLAQQFQQHNLGANWMTDITELDKKVALIEQRLDIIQKNHLHHIEKDIANIKQYFLWGVGVVFVQLIAVIAFLLTN